MSPEGEFCSSTALRSPLRLIVHGVDAVAAADHEALAGEQGGVGVELVVEGRGRLWKPYSDSLPGIRHSRG